MIDFLIDFLTAAPWYTVLFVFVAKVIEVTLSTTRLIIVNRGFKLEGAIVSFIEVLIWVFVASQVVNDVKTAPLLGIIYAFGYAVGVFVGSIVENKMAFGKVMLHIILPTKNAKEVAKYIRDQKIGLTTIEAKGIKDDKLVFITYTNRKNLSELILGIESIEPDALIAENDVVKLTGGTVPKRQRIVK
ncbi:DUF2179 domain-containing protein [Acholeplasma granularum]|uniref:DUF2179 domain-containing protein n=1 Tax=Acholeplasma granularum TaxID=264635 RepID=UPI0004B1D87C|nr:DUF5698 domain-containing protein [Acholeplasma granularum]